MPKVELTRTMAYAAACDAANRRMRAAGRTAWDEDDYAACVAEFNRLWPEERDHTVPNEWDDVLR